MPNMPKIVQEALASLHPELAESEDERIRKNIIGYIQERIDEFPGDVRLVKRWKKEIAWLESLPERFTLSIKQEWDGFDEDCLKRAIWYVENPAPSVIKDFRLALWLNTLRSRFFLTPQPKETWSEEDEKMLTDISWAIRHCAYDDKKKERVMKWFNDDYRKSLRPQPKQEWSKEDENKIERLAFLVSVAEEKEMISSSESIDLRRFVKSYHPQPKQEWSEEEKDKLNSIERLIVNANAHGNYLIGDKEATDLQHFIRSIVKPTTNLTEWSEEDEKMRNSTLLFVDQHRLTHPLASKCYDWLKSLRPSWKPSEEQMEALERASTNKYLSVKQFDILVSLYEQLKKLM